MLLVFVCVTLGLELRIWKWMFDEYDPNAAVFAPCSSELRAFEYVRVIIETHTEKCWEDLAESYSLNELVP